MKSSQIKTIDAHTHLGLEAFIVKEIPPEKLQMPAFRDPMENRVEKLITRMDANGIDKAITFPYPLEEVDAFAANTYVMEAYRAYPDRIIPFVLVGDDVEYWLGQGARGFKQHGLLQTPDRFDMMRAYRVIAESRVPIIIHFNKKLGSIAGQAKDIINKVPALVLIIAHLGRHKMNTGVGVDEILESLQDYENIYLETSTVRDPAVIHKAAELYPDRLVFGSDFPFNSNLDPDPVKVELDVINSAGMPDHVRKKVLGVNILHCLGYSPIVDATG